MSMDAVYDPMMIQQIGTKVLPGFSLLSGEGLGVGQEGVMCVSGQLHIHVDHLEIFI